MIKTFQARLILFVLVLLAAVQMGTALAVLSSLKKDNYQQGVQSLEVAQNVFDLFLESRAEQLTQGVELLASDFGFKQAVATQETVTILSALKNHGARINADISLLVSPAGEVIASTQAVYLDAKVTKLADEARRSGGSSINAMITYSNHAYQLVLVPVRAPNIVAWVGMAFLLDQDLAEQIKEVTGLDISFIYETQSAHILYAGSTLPRSAKRTLLNDMESISYILGSPIFSSDEKYLSSGVDLGLFKQWGVIHLPYDPWLESYNSTRNQLLLIFSVALSLALLLGGMFARHLTRPINYLVEYARNIGRGDSKQRLDAPKVVGEFGLLSNTMEAMQASIIQREEELLYRSSHDLLTGLLNQSAMERYLQDRLAKEKGSLVMVTIHHFKIIVNMLGVEVGNLLLSKVAKRLSDWNHDVFRIARLSDDKFLVVLNEDFTEQHSQSLLTLFVPEFETESCSSAQSCIRLDIRMAVLLFKQATNNVDDAMRRLELVADKANNDNKQCLFYQQGQDENHQRQLTIIRDVSSALSSGQLFVVYQPKITLGNDQCEEAEALIRWVHPELGFLPPDEFIRLLEHAGNIQELTEWMIDSVLIQLSQWWSQGDQIRVAVNLSAYDLMDDRLPEKIEAALAKHHLPHRALALEVTESAVMEDREKVIQVLQALQKKGIHLAIDDFGTGQSSLAYLRELPVNEVKIDRAFVEHIATNKGDEFITKSSIDLSHSLGFTVTAEGAEDNACVALLRLYQCDKIQGYVYSKPLKGEEFIHWRTVFHAA